MRNPTRVAIAVAIVGAVLGATTAVPAVAAPIASTVESATPPRTLDGIKSAANLAVTKRTAALDVAAARVTARPNISDTHKATIIAIFDADSAGLKELNATIQADTDRAAAAQHYGQIFTDYRVYAVAIPQAYIAGAADAISDTAVPALQSAHDKLAAALEQNPNAETQAILDDMQKQIDEAASGVDGVADSALAVTPADFNANRTVLSDKRASLIAAVAAAKQARILGHEVLAALK
jgi:hypothetical protein